MGVLTAKCICGNEPRARAHVDVLLFRGERVVGHKFIGDDLDANELANSK